ncbi:hypothetical protein EVAR_81789_1 [Eumeta japonica]|uniref:Uncharacterized protein n=1 Tax=Eumeta variegata TaxID=151549 RepID=A0A4C1UJ44_EUMVA|nr:hypothetical protein EVAR_81789_1 [Eumeta japonica]
MGLVLTITDGNIVIQYRAWLMIQLAHRRVYCQPSLVNYLTLHRTLGLRVSKGAGEHLVSGGLHALLAFKNVIQKKNFSYSRAVYPRLRLLTFSRARDHGSDTTVNGEAASSGRLYLRRETHLRRLSGPTVYQ